MTDRPIIFSAPMVRALLAGRKTMTRRLLAGNRSRWQCGDRLWVRENWTHTGVGVWSISDARMALDGRPAYAADGGSGPWWPSIHMPREFSRLTLVITAVKIERLQEITEEDARAHAYPVDTYSA